MSIPASVWLLAARPKTLTAGVIPVIAATALAFRQTGQIAWWIFICTLACALLIQIGTNYINDAWDFKKGSDTAERLGPDRATQLGLIDADTLLTAAFVILFAALCCGIPLVIAGGVPILIVGIASLFFAWGYTAGPSLAYRGLGELFVLLFFGIIAVCGTYYLQAKTVNPFSVLLGLQVGLFAVLIIEVNNLRDIDGDRKANKKTLAVVFGHAAARKAIGVICLLPFLLGLFWLSTSLPAALLPLLLVPFAFSIVLPLQSLPGGKTFNSFLAKSALLHALFGGMITAALLWR